MVNFNLFSPALTTGSRIAQPKNQAPRFGTSNPAQSQDRVEFSKPRFAAGVVDVDLEDSNYVEAQFDYNSPSVLLYPDPEKLHNMTKLSLRLPDSDRDEHLIAIAPHLKSVESLEISHHPGLTARGYEALQQCPKLKALDVSWSDIGAEEIAAIVKLQQLTTLDASVNELGDSEMAEIANNLPNLAFLNVGQNKDVGLEGIAALGKLPKLANLQLTGINVDAQEADALTKFPSLAKLFGMDYPEFTIEGQRLLKERRPEIKTHESGLIDDWLQ